jgi:K+-sensing histidine kinase KdpD
VWIDRCVGRSFGKATLNSSGPVSGSGGVVVTEETARLRRAEAFGFRMRWLLIAASAVLVAAFPPRDPWPMAVLGVVILYNLCGWWILPRLTTEARGRASGLASLALLNVFAVAISFSYSYISESPGWLVFYFLPMSAALRFGVRASVPQALVAVAIDGAARYYAQGRYGLDVDLAALVLRGAVYTGIAVFAGVWAETVLRQRRQLDRAAAEAEARAQRLHALSEIQRERFARALDPREVHENVVQAAVELLGADVARVWIVERESGALGLTAEAGGKDVGAALDEAAAAKQAASAKQAVVAEADGGGYAAYAAMRYEGNVVGVLGVAGAGERPGQEQLDLLDALAASGAIAVENARLFGIWGESQALHRLDQLKSEFIGTISHELRTPLTAILGLAEILATMPAASPTVRTAAGEMLRSSEVMARLVDDLLTFAEFEKGDVVVRHEPVTVEPFLNGAVAGAARLPGGERLRLEPGDPALVASADPVRLRQVMSNLLANALRYAPSGPIVVRYMAEGDVVRIEVSDEGPGIGADEGGAVGLTSPPAGGTTFWLTLPAAVPARGTAIPAAAARR